MRSVIARWRFEDTMEWDAGAAGDDGDDGDDGGGGGGGATAARLRITKLNREKVGRSRVAWCTRISPLNNCAVTVGSAAREGYEIAGWRIRIGGNQNHDESPPRRRLLLNRAKGYEIVGWRTLRAARGGGRPDEIVFRQRARALDGSRQATAVQYFERDECAAAATGREGEGGPRPPPA